MKLALLTLIFLTSITISKANATAAATPSTRSEYIETEIPKLLKGSGYTYIPYSAEFQMFNSFSFQKSWLRGLLGQSVIGIRGHILFGVMDSDDNHHMMLLAYFVCDLPADPNQRATILDQIDIGFQVSTILLDYGQTYFMSLHSSFEAMNSGARSGFPRTYEVKPILWSNDWNPLN